MVWKFLISLVPQHCRIRSRFGRRSRCSPSTLRGTSIPALREGERRLSTPWSNNCVFLKGNLRGILMSHFQTEDIIFLDKSYLGNVFNSISIAFETFADWTQSKVCWIVHSISFNRRKEMVAAMFGTDTHPRQTEYGTHLLCSLELLGSLHHSHWVSEKRRGWNGNYYVVYYILIIWFWSGLKSVVDWASPVSFRS